jgi:hypothetical protein
MGLHTGEVQERGGDYFGPAVHPAAGSMAAGHGGSGLWCTGSRLWITQVQGETLSHRSTARVRRLHPSDQEHFDT